MKYVLDSCVAFKWVVPETDTDKAIRLRDDYVNGVHELVAPDVFPIEIAHALTRAQRQGRVEPSHSLPLLADVMTTCPHLSPSLPLLTRAFALSSQLNIGVYDCLYVTLAQEEGCELVTADDRLIRTFAPVFTGFVALASLP